MSYKTIAFKVFSSTNYTTCNIGSIMKCMMISATLMLSVIAHAMETPKIELNRGILIAIEGIDGSGKSTLANHLYNALQPKYAHVKLTKEPGDTEVGKKIREIVQTQTTPLDPKTEFLLFAADRAEHFSKMIELLLKQNYIIISDRLADSSLAYQGYGRDLDKNMIASVNRWAMDKITPDLTIFVKVPDETALERIQKRNETVSTFEKEPFLKKVAAGFEKIYEKYCSSESFKTEFKPEARQLYIETLESPGKKFLSPYATPFNLTTLDSAEFKTVPAKHVKLITVDGTQSEHAVATNTITVVSEWIKLNNQ
jgi:dTMP kinase